MPYGFYNGPDKADKGKKHGSCNRSTCQDSGAIWYNHGSYAWYCVSCMNTIYDDWAKRHWEQDFPEVDYPMFETQEMIDRRAMKSAADDMEKEMFAQVFGGANCSEQVVPGYWKEGIKYCSCGSTGFKDSVIPGQCEFCDGTFGGNPPEISTTEIMAGMYGAKLRPYQQKILDSLIEMDFSKIEKQIFLNARSCGKSTLQHRYREYYGTITGRFPNSNMVIMDDFCETYVPWDSIQTTNSEEKDWARTRFKRDTLSSDPSATKRKALRAKRKKRSKRHG